MSTNFFSSLNGKFDLNSSMSSLYGDYNTIKSGAYGSLMKSYVGKVGNKAALKAYQETGDIFNQEVAERFRKYILSPGGIDKGSVMYHNFRGREPKVDGLLENRGLK